ncbi:GGDEF domain-containing protein [Rhizobium sp. XQZ8]|uniref:GGDEF domain-containing protein n=1 Tax=Rhizobium populisoli TaxID=2859785 RepID=UPI001C679BA8|nr:GGDEF domain-containing protein [Rhizobium populisoli]MBW6424691.1 GGDEF domain-containing protein [Rhizobium populisoli]
MSDKNHHDAQSTSILLDAVARELGRKDLRLKFAPRLEALFQEETAESRNRQTIIASLFALVVFNAFLFIDHASRPEIFGQAVFLRVVVTTLPCLFALAWLHRLPPVWARDAIMSSAVLLVTLTSNILLWHSTSQMAHYNAFSFGLIVIAGNIVLQIRFPVAVATSVACCVMSAVFLSGMTLLSSEEKHLPVFYMSAMAAITLIANYRLEKTMRHSYLLMLRERLRGREMGYLNEQLSTYSYTDPLTGIANRRMFDQVLDEAWRAGRLTNEKLSLLIIDIDFFKRYNDAFGHPAGDDCLQQVARAIEAQTRAGTDLPARLGGEEFAVLLRNMDQIQALTVAARIHRAVRQLALTHGRPDGGGWVTVSIGLASISPASDMEPKALIDAADAALYEAKRAGRNRTFQATNNAA